MVIICAAEEEKNVTNFYLISSGNQSVKRSWASANETSRRRKKRMARQRSRRKPSKASSVLSLLETYPTKLLFFRCQHLRCPSLCNYQLLVRSLLNEIVKALRRKERERLDFYCCSFSRAWRNSCLRHFSGVRFLVRTLYLHVVDVLSADGRKTKTILLLLLPGITRFRWRHGYLA